MTPATLNLEIVRGLTFDAVKIVCKTAGNVVVPINGWKAYAGAENAAGSYLALPVSVTAPALGEITLATMPPSETVRLELGAYTWHLVLEDNLGNRSGPYLTGTVTISELNVQLPNA